MFTTAAAGASHTRGRPRFGKATRLHRRRSRVRGLPETMGELPAVALAGLECMVAVDIYVNETTRHADVILPAPSALQKGHCDVALPPPP
ncbi:MAG TPA: hypothetical protein VFV32_01350 [Acidimicrobiales bacterium]|nr:hypothetical protein [Acidimicrobiales bacterium]